jgi:hypothetical protein
MASKIDLDRFRALAKAGAGPKALMAEFGCTHVAVIKFARVNQIVYQGEIEIGIVAQMKACAAAGLTQAETARELGRARSGICRMALQHGIEFHGVKPAPKPAPKPDLPARTADLISTGGRYACLAMFAAKYGLTEAMARQEWHRLGSGVQKQCDANDCLCKRVANV